MSKHTALRVLAVVAFICAIVGTMATEKADAKTVGDHCSYEGVINGYGSTTRSWNVEFGLYFHEWECTKNGQRIFISNANTWRETEVLQDWVTEEMYFMKRPVVTGTIWCGGKGDNSYLIYAQYRVTTYNPTKAEIASYNQWAERYADRHGCLIS